MNRGRHFQKSSRDVPFQPRHPPLRTTTASASIGSFLRKAQECTNPTKTKTKWTETTDLQPSQKIPTRIAQTVTKWHLNEGFMTGHIFIRPKSNPTRYKIRASNGKFYTYEGTPKEGDFLRRHAPVVFRCSRYGFRAEELTEIKNPKDASCVIPLKGSSPTSTWIATQATLPWPASTGRTMTTPSNFASSTWKTPIANCPKSGHMSFSEPILHEATASTKTARSSPPKVT